MDFHLIGQQNRTNSTEGQGNDTRGLDGKGRPVPFLSHVEQAAKKAGLKSLVNIAAALDVTVDRLLTGNQFSDPDALTRLQRNFEACVKGHALL